MDNSFELPALPEPWGNFEFQLDAEDGQWVEAEDGKPVFSADQMRAYAIAAVEAEREACAKLCEEMAYALDNGGNPYLYDRKAIQMAAKIRARGKP